MGACGWSKKYFGVALARMESSLSSDSLAAWRANRTGEGGRIGTFVVVVVIVAVTAVFCLASPDTCRGYLTRFDRACVDESVGRVPGGTVCFQSISKFSTIRMTAEVTFDLSAVVGASFSSLTVRCSKRDSNVFVAMMRGENVSGGLQEIFEPDLKQQIRAEVEGL